MLSEKAFHDFMIEYKYGCVNDNLKTNMLSLTNCHFSPQQAIALISLVVQTEYKVRAIKHLSERFGTYLNSREAADILQCFSTSQIDKLSCLDILKGHICDMDSHESMTNILSVFPYESDKVKALKLIKHAQYYVDEIMPAGGHQSYAAVGGVFSQAPPLRENLYGPFHQQKKKLAASAKPLDEFKQRNSRCITSELPNQTSFLYHGDLNRSWYQGGKAPSTIHQ